MHRQNIKTTTPTDIPSIFIKNVYNQFLLLKNYRLWHWIRKFTWFIPTNLESIIFDQLTSQGIPTGVSLVETLLKNRRVKAGKQTLIESTVFKIALEIGRERKFWLGELWLCNSFVILKATFRKHWLVE